MELVAQRDDEIFDVVNDRNEVVGQDTRANVHRLGLMHRAIHVLVFNAAGQLFLQKRSMAKDTHPGCWDSSASGHLDAGEDYDVAMIRELHEELGVSECDPRRLLYIEACEDTGQEFVWVYRMQDEGPFMLHPAEIETGEWFEPEEVDRLIAEKPGECSTGLALIWQRYQSELSQDVVK